MTRKLLFLTTAGLFCFSVILMAGCTSEFYKHDTVFKNWDHIAYSWWGYKDPSPETCEQSTMQGAWGEAYDCDLMPYIPAQ
jgi:hypothetical protein